MPFLEQRWQPSAAAAHLRRNLIDLGISQTLLDDWPWPLTWGLIHLAGSALGAGLDARWPLLWVPPPWLTQVVLARASALLPVLLCLKRPRLTWLVWILVLGGSIVGGWSEATSRTGRFTASAENPESPSAKVERHGVGVIRITSWPATGERGRWKAAGILLDWQSATGPTQVDVPLPGAGLLVAGQGESPLPGTVISGIFTLSVPPRGDLPGAFDYREFLAGRHITWQAKLLEGKALPGPGRGQGLVRGFLAPLRDGVIDELSALFPRPEAELAGAVLLGSRTPGSREGAMPFADLGLAHLFAVSGLHVGILLGIVVLPGRLVGLSAAWRFLPLILFLPVYSLLTGLPGSVIRAAGLGLLAGGAAALGRQGRPLHLLGLLFWLTTILEPVQVLDTGVRLSYLAAGGILATVRLVRSEDGTGGFLSGLWTALAVSLAAQWFTLPQAALSFGRFSLLSPVANLVAVPLFGLGVWAVVLALCCAGIWPWLGQALAAIGWLLLRGLTGLVTMVAGGTGGMNAGLAPTGPGLWLLWAGLTAAGLIILRGAEQGLARRRPALLSVAILVVAGHGLFALSGYQMIRGPQVRVWQFDVGQGDCALVVFPDGWKCLIDAGGVFGSKSDSPDGPVNRSVIPFLKRGWVRNLDLVVLGHGHLDHTGGAAALQNAFPIGSLVVGGDAGQDIAVMGPVAPVIPGRGVKVLHQWDQWSLTLLGPEEELPADFHENDRSLVLTLNDGLAARMVWSGDLENEGEAHLLDQGFIPAKTEVWKAGHHGSNTSGSQAWVDRLDPELILVSCGVGNKYGHPNHGQYRVEGRTIPILRTDLEGTISLRWDSQGVLHWSTALGRRGSAGENPQIQGLP